MAVKPACSGDRPRSLSTSCDHCPQRMAASASWETMRISRIGSYCLLESEFAVWKQVAIDRCLYTRIFVSYCQYVAGGFLIFEQSASLRILVDIFCGPYFFETDVVECLACMGYWLTKYSKVYRQALSTLKLSYWHFDSTLIYSFLGYRSMKLDDIFIINTDYYYYVDRNSLQRV